MIDRFDVQENLVNYERGRYVLYEDHLTVLAEKDKEIKRLTESLLYYVKEALKEKP